MIQIGEHYKLGNGFDLWMKVIDEYDDYYKTEIQIIYKNNQKALHQITEIRKDFLDHKENMGELQFLNHNEKIIFEL